MRVEGLTLALRRRPPWEAVDLGVALVRRHARPIFGAWLATTAIAFVVLNALLLPLGLGWLAALLLWWIKPLFDRIPVHVLSRAILGQTPGVRDTLRAQWREGWGAIWPWLLWRRLHPGRSLLLAVDLLEGLRGARRRERVGVLQRGQGSTPLLLWVIGFHLEAMLWLSIIAFFFMLIPTEFLSDSVKAVFDLLMQRPPWWLELINNALYWVALAVVEPFYVGAGFALYLNRRTQLEAWDVELAFRRLAARLRGAGMVLLLGIAAALSPMTPAMSQDDASGARGAKDWHAPRPVPDAGGTPPPAAESDPEADEPFEPDLGGDRFDAEARKAATRTPGEITPLDQLFGAPPGDAGADFAAAAARAMLDPDLSPKETVGRWRALDEDAARREKPPAWVESLAAIMALIMENLLWILLALILILALIHHRRWLPWLLARGQRPSAEPMPDLSALPLPEALPRDALEEVLRRWRAGESRAALALLYRVALAALVDRLGSPLPPGATEDECLRLARRLPAPGFVAVFRRVVGCWQAAAYAHRLPADAELVALLDDWRAAHEVRA